MDDEKTPLNPRQANTSGRPFVGRQSDRPVPYPFKASADDTLHPPHAQTPSQSSVLKAKNKKVLLFMLIATALLILGLGLTYVYWYQNPSKVVSDALLNAVSSKSLTYSGVSTLALPTKVDVAFDGAAIDKGGSINAKFTFLSQSKKYALEGSGLLDEKNDLYIKVKNIDELIGNYRKSIPASSQKEFDQIYAKINNKWVKVSSDDQKNFNPNLAKTQKCTAEAIKTIQGDNAIKKELISAYKKHPFITIDKSLGANGGSLGYTLKSDQTITKAFVKEYKNTSFYKSLVKCDSSFTLKDDLSAQNRSNDNGITRTDVWVDRWTHQVTKVSLKTDDKSAVSDVTIEPKFNRPVNVTTPKGATTLDQLQKDVQALLQPASSAPIATPTP
jgi:hypothetical protein